jgi:hypothetical protein
MARKFMSSASRICALLNLHSNWRCEAQCSCCCLSRDSYFLRLQSHSFAAAWTSSGLTYFLAHVTFVSRNVTLQAEVHSQKECKTQMHIFTPFWLRSFFCHKHSCKDIPHVFISEKLSQFSFGQQAWGLSWFPSRGKRMFYMFSAQQGPSEHPLQCLPGSCLLGYDGRDLTLTVITCPEVSA